MLLLYVDESVRLCVYLSTDIIGECSKFDCIYVGHVNGDRTSALSGRDGPYLNTGSQKCYIYGQVLISVRALNAGSVHLFQLRVGVYWCK